MKIGFVLDDTLDTADGVQQQVLLLGSWLSQHDHDVHYLTTKSTRKDLENLHSLGKHLKIKFNRNIVPLVLPSSAKKIAEVLEREKFDILHVQMPYGPAFGARVISLAPPKTAIVGTFHIAPYSITEKALSSVLGYWLKPTVPMIDKVISVSKPAQELAKASFGFDSVVIPNMVDTASFKLSSKLSRHSVPHLIFVGRLVERKGCNHFIESMALMKSDFKATIVGDGSQRQKLEKLAAKLKIDDRVKFVGYVSEDKKRRLLAKADIAVFPATGGESFGIVLIEAMSAGSCIVLAGDNPGYASVLGRLKESMVKPTDHVSFAEAIDLFAGDERRAQRLYNAQQNLVSQYDVNIVAKQVVEIYYSALAHRQKKSHTKG